MRRFLELVDNWAVPGLLIVTYLVLIATSEMSPWIAGVTLVMLGGVLALWLAFRELRFHAAATRLAAIGEPDELLALATRALDRRLLERGKVALRIYIAIAHRLRGDAAEAARALEAADLSRLRGAARKSWTLVAGAQRVAIAAHAGQAAQARAIYNADVAPARAGAGPGALAIADEALAWTLLAEGQHDEARAIAHKLAKDVRLGPATRAAAKWLVAKAAEPTDKAAATTAFAEAAALAPKTWMASPGGSST